MSLLTASRRTTFLPLTTPTGTAEDNLVPMTAGASWSQVGPDLWSGIHGTEFLGTVEYTDYTFTARDYVGTAIGTYNTLADAQAQILRPTGLAYLARHHINTLQHVPARTLRSRATTAVLGLAATAVAAALLIGTLHS